MKKVNVDELQFFDQFNGLVRVLKDFNYIDEEDQPLIKARVAKELGEN
jgi:hypothetical protein